MKERFSMQKEFTASLKLTKANLLSPLLRALSSISKALFGRIDFSKKASQVILDARQEASNREHDTIRLEHILLSLLKSEHSPTIEILQNLESDVKSLQQQTETETNKLPQRHEITNLPFSRQAEQAMKAATRIAKDFRTKAIEPEHIRLAILKTDKAALRSIFRRFNITYERCCEQLKRTSSIR
ncbi:hypothetical protein GWO43_22260 [candidate division KSB1 bacterium]|nr:hypothetical protein [candidate division KSB1 bacterium]NIR72624.1 hypothetical protein [candidate division KSB1 bacterium]NIS27335.1 hypothetical protein [candidate division KSB1 bacterium]NIT73548.1 hypothetical protein [candidate division KSB1 bacterium]NIU25396.1 hypothetical protein [candidate division KSB1 bacterium]